jgi:hypothetical protein
MTLKRPLYLGAYAIRDTGADLASAQPGGNDLQKGVASIDSEAGTPTLIPTAARVIGRVVSLGRVDPGDAFSHGIIESSCTANGPWSKLRAVSLGSPITASAPIPRTLGYHGS